MYLVKKDHLNVILLDKIIMLFAGCYHVSAQYNKIGIVAHCNGVFFFVLLVCLFKIHFMCFDKHFFFHFPILIY